MVIAVDGACPGNGTDGAVKSGYGVYIGDSNAVQNHACRVPDTLSYAHTSQRAELYAALVALHVAKQYAVNGDSGHANLHIVPPAAGSDI